MKYLAIVASLALASSLAIAEGHRGEGQGKHGERLKRMQQHLQLTDEQVEQIREIRRNGGNREDVRAVLTEEQIQKMEEHRARRAAQGGHGGPHKWGGPPGEESAEEG